MPRTFAAVVSVVAFLAVSEASHAAAPPNRNDPCARGGRDSCGTTGVGFYGTYRYGVRWFGDYRGAIRGQAHTFCLDLGYWYASRGFRYRRQPAPLRTRDGRLVPVERQRRIAYAIWRYGRSSDPRRQAAVMLYVHSQMGDARAGEADPGAVGHGVAPLFRRIARASARDHGPYRIQVRLPAVLVVGRPATAVIRVLAAHGAPLPYVRLTVAMAGATGAPAAVRTSAAGLARLALTPTAAAGVRLRLRTEVLAATRPLVYAPTTAAARVNAQRLAVPAAQSVSSSVTHAVVAAPQLSTHASAQTAEPGGSVSDSITVSGLGGATVNVDAELWGPYPDRDGISCSGTPFWKGTVSAHGDGTLTTPPVRLDRAGYYAFRETIVAQPLIRGVVTPCGDTAETVFVQAKPALQTQASDSVVNAGSSVFDKIGVKGLGKTPAKLEVELFGPFPTRSAIRCTSSHLRWHSRVFVSGNGRAKSRTVGVKRPGFYAFRERLVGTPLVAGMTTGCASDTRILLAAPRIVTGRGDVARFVETAGIGGRTPVRVRISALGIDAPISPSGIDLVHGVLGIPADIHRVGWWRDGGAPGDRTGTILVAGHVDSARAGAGAFFRLRGARVGDTVRLATAAGGSFTYRVASVRSYLKSKLPTSVFRRTGPARLVLVTCGGPFDAATGHYRDDVVVTAVPVR